MSPAAELSPPDRGESRSPSCNPELPRGLQGSALLSAASAGRSGEEAPGSPARPWGCNSTPDSREQSAAKGSPARGNVQSGCPENLGLMFQGRGRMGVAEAGGGLGPRSGEGRAPDAQGGEVLDSLWPHGETPSVPGLAEDQPRAGLDPAPLTGEVWLWDSVRVCVLPGLHLQLPVRSWGLQQDCGRCAPRQAWQRGCMERPTTRAVQRLLQDRAGALAVVPAWPQTRRPGTRPFRRCWNQGSSQGFHRSFIPCFSASYSRQKSFNRCRESGSDAQDLATPPDCSRFTHTRSSEPHCTPWCLPV